MLGGPCSEAPDGSQPRAGHLADGTDIIRRIQDGHDSAAPLGLEDLRPRLIPVGGATRWDEGELARALLSLDDQAVFERCEPLLDLAWVRERALDSSKHARAIALRGWVRSIAVDPSGRYIGVGAGSGEIQIWDRDTATLRCRLVGHCGRVLSLAFTVGVDRLISGAADGTVRLWSLTDASELCQLRLEASLLTCVTDASRGRALVATLHHLNSFTCTTAAAKGTQIDAG